MPFITSKVHGTVDYVIALLSIFSPVLFSFGEGNIETIVPIVFGMLLILYSFFTDYEVGLARQLPLYLHYRLDQMAGVLLAASPWLLNFHETAYLAHLMLGICLVVNSFLASDDIPTLLHAVRGRSWSKFRIPSNQG